jgi:uncharacterized membrane protein
VSAPPPTATLDTATPTRVADIPSPQREAPPVRGRLDSIDLLRGIVMVIMVLDHTRDFAFAGTLQFNPTDLSHTTPAIFFTRWITHFCAPVFVFLAGTGTYLQLTRGRSRSDLSWYLVTRGLWLILLEFTVVKLSFTFSLDWHFLGAAQVIWVIGISMILLAALIWLPLPAIAAFGLGMIGLHNLLDRFPVYQWQGPGSPLPTLGQAAWALAHAQFQPLPLGHPFPVILAAYAVIPWVGVMAAGYAFGAVYRLPADRRRRLLVAWGIGATLGFVALRLLNVYGDPSPWSRQANTTYTLLSFLNTTKYPPSLQYLLMTLGPALLALAWFETLPKSSITAPLITFGRVPLFFYLLQWPAAHALTLAFTVASHHPTGYLFWQFPLQPPAPGTGFRLRTTYLIWLITVILLYPLSRWYAGVKRRHRDWRWLTYL